MSGFVSTGGAPRHEIIEAPSTSIIAIPGRLSTCYVVAGSQGGVIIDPGSTTMLPDLHMAVDKLKTAVAAVGVTHVHFDHILGLEAVAGTFAVPILAGPFARSFFAGKSTMRYPAYGGSVHLAANWIRQGMPTMPLGDLRPLRKLRRGACRLLVSPENELHHRRPVPMLPGWQTLLLAGHSPEDVAFYHPPSGILIAGDLVANLRGGEWNKVLTDPVRYAEAKQQLRSLEVSAILPGHGPVITGKKIWQRLLRR